MKYFIITVDTEGDNLWEYHGDGSITTTNASVLPRFQNLCNKYDFKPVYLSNYEMVSDDNFVDFAKNTQNMGQCEVGLHIHAWNNPPLFTLPIDNSGQAYLIEYPEEIMKQKVSYTYDLIKKKFGEAPVSHRAGRWAMNDTYFRILREIGIKIDCSYTPYVDWTNSIGANRGGCDYRKVSIFPQTIDGICEVPMSIQRGDFVRMSRLSQLKMFIKGKTLPRHILWLRPACNSLEGMKQVLDIICKNKNLDYAEFMIHSSELMAGGSPYFTTEESIALLYETMDQLFAYAKQKGFIGCTLKEYYEKKS